VIYLNDFPMHFILLLTPFVYLIYLLFGIEQGSAVFLDYWPKNMGLKLPKAQIMTNYIF
jgi:hypothetical protein